jgi:hypothetical protein
LRVARKRRDVRVGRQETAHERTQVARGLFRIGRVANRLEDAIGQVRKAFSGEPTEQVVRAPAQRFEVLQNVGVGEELDGELLFFRRGLIELRQ